MNNTHLDFCILIPCYEKHALLLNATIQKYAHLSYSYIVIDDGSSIEFSKIISQTCSQRSEMIQVLRLDVNSGKGAAVQAGINHAHLHGHTHALQIDADGQHDHHAIDLMIDLAKKNPFSIISGKPVYDSSIPKVRLYGRYITHFWTWVETLSFNLEDSMCGFRCYPLKPIMSVLEKYRIGTRMDFDTDIMVRSYWEKTPTLFFPVQVSYPLNGASYFKSLDDNINISKMHTRLFFGMLIRIPQIISFNSSQKELPWHKKPERGFTFLLKFSLWSFFILGDGFIRSLSKLISFYYTIFAFKEVRQSKKYRELYSQFCLQNNLLPQQFTPYQHINSFADMIIDKVAVWKGRITRQHIDSDDLKTFYQNITKERGALFISSHYGNIDITRAIGSDSEQVKFNALMYTNNSKKITQLINELNPNSRMNIIAVDKFDIRTGSLLKEKIDGGEHIFCMGDRTTLGSDKNIQVSLLGRLVTLPLGPFMISYLLKTPTFSFHCYKDKKNGTFRINTVKIDPSAYEDRDDFINAIASSYTNSLEKLILNDPLQWYNFNNSW